MIVRYAQMKGNKNDEKALRKLIMETGATAAPERSEVHLRAAYWMIRRWPRLLKGMYPLYRHARQLLWAVAGRRGE